MKRKSKEILKIRTHFQQIGGLERIVQFSVDDQRDIEQFLKIEKYLKKPLIDDIKDLLLAYQGMSFAKAICFETLIDIPILGGGRHLDFGVFLTLSESNYDLFSILESNSDLFGKQILPFAEATPGDYIGIDLDSGEVFFISHDFDEKLEKSHYKIANSLSDYCLGLKEEPEIFNDEETTESEPRVVKAIYSDKFNELMNAHKDKTKNK
jgi:hypothetical protein